MWQSQHCDRHDCLARTTRVIVVIFQDRYQKPLPDIHCHSRHCRHCHPASARNPPDQKQPRPYRHPALRVRWNSLYLNHPVSKHGYPRWSPVVGRCGSDSLHRRLSAPRYLQPNTSTVDQHPGQSEPLHVLW